MAALDSAAEAFVTGLLGRIVAIEPVGTAGAAFRIEAERGRVAYLKAHRSSGKHQRERAAYERWAPRLSAPTPALIAAEDRPRALLLSALPGRPVGAETPDARGLFEQAGRALAELHGLPVHTEDPVPLPEALVARAEGWARRAGAHTPRLAARIVARIEGIAPEVQGTLRVPCHRDFEPRNWLAIPDPRGPQLGLLDFEHSRPDLWLCDVVRLAAQLWPSAPELEAAFWRGYGRAPSPREARVLDALVELELAVTYTWGLQHDDARFTDRGARGLRRLGLDLE